MTRDEIFRMWLRADEAWSAELHRLFGSDSLARYTPRGQGVEGSELRRCADAFKRLRDAWLDYSEPEWITPSEAAAMDDATKAASEATGELPTALRFTARERAVMSSALDFWIDKMPSNEASSRYWRVASGGGQWTPLYADEVRALENRLWETKVTPEGEPL